MPILFSNQPPPIRLRNGSHPYLVSDPTIETTLVRHLEKNVQIVTDPPLNLQGKGDLMISEK